MEDSRRDFIKKASATIAPTTVFSGCIGGEDNTGIDQLYLKADLETAHREIDGMEISVNMFAYAEDDLLEEIELQYTEPGEETWEVLAAQDAESGEAQINESFNGEIEGNYQFRSVAYTEGEEYMSEVEEVEFL